MSRPKMTDKEKIKALNKRVRALSKVNIRWQELSADNATERNFYKKEVDKLQTDYLNTARDKSRFEMILLSILSTLQNAQFSNLNLRELRILRELSVIYNLEVTKKQPLPNVGAQASNQSGEPMNLVYDGNKWTHKQYSNDDLAKDNRPYQGQSRKRY